MPKTSVDKIALMMIAGLLMSAAAIAGETATVSTSVDLYSRYVWRGADIANTPSIQPSLAVSYRGCELGAWGAYTLSNQASGTDEIDFWLGYTHSAGKDVSVTAIATDYYYPNAGIDFFNFNNYDAVKDDTISDPGAHTIELGVIVAGPPSFPLSVSGYVNVYNDAGSNTYFQLDYSVTVDNTDLNFFCGATGGSKDNPGYYGSDNFAVINTGVTATRNIPVSDRLSVPLTVSFIVNPKAEISYLVVGMSF
jgi:hypothetical protein